MKLTAFALLAAAFAATSTLAATSPLRVGVAAVDITPPVGKIFDRLYAKALVLRQGREAAAIVVCDLPVMDAETSSRARELASKSTGIPASNITVAATHTHSGDPTPGVADKIAQSVIDANRNLVPVSLQGGVLDQSETVSFNRRFLLKDGTVRFNPGLDEKGRSFDGGFPFQHPDIVRPVGPIDPALHFVLFTNAAAEPVASLSSFALHACTCPHQKPSADFPHFLEEKLRTKFGPLFLSVFGAGTCGDINHTDVAKPGPQMGWEERTKPIGESLGATVLASLPSLQPSHPSLAVRHAIVPAPLQTLSQMDLDWARQAIANDFAGFEGVGYGDRGFLAGVRARKIERLAERRRLGDTWPLPVHVVRLSDDTAVVTLPGELFVELGLALKKASPFRNTLVIELANEDIHYVPTSKAYIEGGYEVVNSMLAPGAGELLIDTALRLLQDLRPAAGMSRH